MSEVFGAEQFRELGREIVDLMAGYLKRCGNREIPVLREVEPQALAREWDQEIPIEGSEDGGGAELLSMLRALLEHSNHLHHPGYVGHQIAVPVPAAALVEMVNALLNNGMAVYEMGQLQTVMERRVLEFLAGTVGLGKDFGGVMTHGGSLGNLTALLAARQAKCTEDVWREGNRSPLSVLVSDQAHYCVGRAAQAMGWGADGAWKVGTDAQFRMDTAQLEVELVRAREAGREVIAVVASACSTATGSLDPIDEIAAFCEGHGLWLHVDGAHGASLALSERHRDRVKGIERADSVVWDLHKLMGLPALSTAVLFREKRSAYEAFAQEASYLFDDDPDAEPWFNVGLRTLECTKRAMGVTAFCLLRTLGARWFGEHVDALLERTRWLVEELEASASFEIATAPEANIVCFRHCPEQLSEPGDLDQHQEALRRRVLQSGKFYIVKTRLLGKTWLRVTIMNAMTEKSDLRDLVTDLIAEA